MGDGWRLTTAAFAAFASVTVFAEMEIEVLLTGERVVSTLSDSGETRWVALAGVEGGKLGVVVTAPRGSRVKPRVRVLDPDGESAEIGETNPRFGPVARFAGLRLAKTGIWRIGVETPPDHGGSFVLVTNGSVPRSFRWSAELDGAGGPAEHVLPASPGGTLTLVVASKGKPAFNPSLDLIAPSGAVVAHVTGTKGRAALPRLLLEETGRYSVRVTGGPGTFSAAATVKLPRKRKLAFADVAAQPEIRGFTPASTPDDSVASISFQGVGFTMQQSASIARDGKTLLAAPMKAAGSKGAAADIDLGDLPPGTYSLRIGTPEGRIVTAAEPFVVTNRVPQAGRTDPLEAPNRTPFVLDVVGVGFDAGATASVRRAADGLEIPLVVTDRPERHVLRGTLSPPAWVTGVCDVEVRDPGGAGNVAAGLLDLLGQRAAPVVVASSNAADAKVKFLVYDTVVDETHGRVLLAIRETAGRVTLVLVDQATSAVVDTLALTSADLGSAGSIDYPQVAWDPVGGTFALGVSGTSGARLAVLRIVRDTDIRQTVSQADLATAGPQYVFGISVAADRDSGGYVAVWDETSTTTGTNVIRAQPVPSSGTIDRAKQRVLLTNLAFSNLGLGPHVAYTGAGDFIIAWAGTTNDATQAGLFAAVVDHQVTGVLGPLVMAASTTWGYAYARDVAAQGEGPWALLAFDFVDENDLFHPACMRIHGHTLQHAGHEQIEDAAPPPSTPPGGSCTTVVWNDERHEWVVAYGTYAGRTALRRVNANGSVRLATVFESYEGRFGVVFAGSAPGTLGLARTFDGIANDVSDTTDTYQAIVAPLR